MDELNGESSPWDFAMSSFSFVVCFLHIIFEISSGNSTSRVSSVCYPYFSPKITNFLHIYVIYFFYIVIFIPILIPKIRQFILTFIEENKSTCKIYLIFKLKAWFVN